MRILVVLVAALLCACAPRVQTLGPAAATGGITPHIEGDRYITRDGQALGLNTWEAEEPRAIIIALHGMNDYAHAFEDAATYWAANGVTTYAFDQRGHGRSPQRGIWPGRELMVSDLADFIEVARAAHPGVPVYALGHSMGGAVVLNTIADGRADVEGAILVAPAVWGWSTLQFPLNLILWTSAHTTPGLPVTGESLERWPTDNIEILREMSRDELMVFETRIDAVYGVVSLMDGAYTRAGEMPPPVLVLYGDHDEIIPPRPVADVIAAMCPYRRVATYEDGWHLLLRDLQAQVVWRDIVSFVTDADAPLPSGGEARAAADHPCEED